MAGYFLGNLGMKKIISIILLAFALVLAGYCYAKLPGNVIIQIGFNGQAANTCPKFFAVMVPFGISVAGSIINLTAKEKEKTGKGIVLAFIGISFLVLTLLFNCKV